MSLVNGFATTNSPHNGRHILSSTMATNDSVPVNDTKEGAIV
jgi:hypothetical protein